MKDTLTLADLGQKGGENWMSRPKKKKQEDYGDCEHCLFFTERSVLRKKMEKARGGNKKGKFCPPTQKKMKVTSPSWTGRPFGKAKEGNMPVEQCGKRSADLVVLKKRTDETRGKESQQERRFGFDSVRGGARTVFFVKRGQI